MKSSSFFFRWIRWIKEKSTRIKFKKILLDFILNLFFYRYFRDHALQELRDSCGTKIAKVNFSNEWNIVFAKTGWGVFNTLSV